MSKILSVSELKAVKTFMQDYLGAGMPSGVETNIRWGIPGNSAGCQKVLILDNQYVVTFKRRHGEWESTVYIKAERATLARNICEG